MLGGSNEEQKPIINKQEKERKQQEKEDTQKTKKRKNRHIFSTTF